MREAARGSRRHEQLPNRRLARARRKGDALRRSVLGFGTSGHSAFVNSTVWHLDNGCGVKASRSRRARSEAESQASLRNCLRVRVSVLPPRLGAARRDPLRPPRKTEVAGTSSARRKRAHGAPQARRRARVSPPADGRKGAPRLAAQGALRLRPSAAPPTSARNERRPLSRQASLFPSGTALRRAPSLWSLRHVSRMIQARLQKMQNPTVTACAAPPRFLKNLARAGSLRAASDRFLKTLGQKNSS